MFSFILIFPVDQCPLSLVNFFNFDNSAVSNDKRIQVINIDASVTGNVDYLETKLPATGKNSKSFFVSF